MGDLHSAATEHPVAGTPRDHLPRPGGRHDQARGPDRAACRRARASRRHDDGYADLEPRLAEFATTAPDDPRRQERRDALVAAHWPLVVHIARRYRDRGEPLSDLEQVGAIGLLGALERFDPGSGEFVGFAVPTITGEIRKHFRDRGWAVRVPRRLKDLQGPVRDAVGVLGASLGRAPKPSEIAAHLGTTADQVVEALGAGHAYSVDSLDALSARSGAPPVLGDRLGAVDGALSVAEIRQDLRRALDELSERDRTIVALRFFGDLTQSEIAARIGLSQMHVSRLLTRALETLRRRIGAP